ncbi:MAG TPA: nuclear transport factor 2 family protein [Pedobacter sp.]|nr:nuclear transport factor 2 family protein [Pedobacter sp.]
MDDNEKLIHSFYSNFQNKNVKGMRDCYGSTVTFNDPVFTNLSAGQVRAMWAMLLRNGKDLRIEFKNIRSSGNSVSAQWNAYYTFSATGNKVINNIRASFIIEDGKIIRHTDNFSFYNWARQSLGLTGILLGWTSFLKNKIRTKAKKNLDIYMASSGDN